MKNVWDNIFKKKKWGEYPPEDLIRFIKRFKKKNKKKKILKVLELGCGPGCNLNFYKKEDFKVYGIDISKTAIIKSRRLFKRKDMNNFVIGNFSNLNWNNGYFDCVVDNFSVYANKTSEIKKTYKEIHRVLKKGGYFFSKVWGRKTLGFGRGKKIENSTFTNIKSGPCKNMGLSHFFSINELKKLNKIFSFSQIDKNCFTDKYVDKNYYVEIFISTCKK